MLKDTLHRDSYPLKSSRGTKYIRHVETKLATFALACGGMKEHIAQDSETSKRSLIRPNGIRKKQGQIQEDQYTYTHSVILLISLFISLIQAIRMLEKPSNAIDG